MEKDPVAVKIQERLTPYVERVEELQRSLEDKDNEIGILRLAVERLMAIKTEMSKPSGQSKGPKRGKRGGASKGRSSTRKASRTGPKRKRP